jgi:hypothetical protein
LDLLKTPDVDQDDVREQTPEPAESVTDDESSSLSSTPGSPQMSVMLERWLGSSPEDCPFIALDVGAGRVRSWEGEGVDQDMELVISEDEED